MCSSSTDMELPAGLDWTHQLDDVEAKAMGRCFTSAWRL